MQRPRIRVLLALLTLICASVITAHAGSRDFGRDLTEVEVESPVTLPAPDEPAIEAGEGPPAPLRPVIAFLQLEEFQIVQFVTLFEQRERALSPIVTEIGQLERALEQLLENPAPEPPVVGSLVLQIRQRRAVVHAIQAEFLMAFENVLDESQRQRLHAARTAKALQPILPALGAVGLI